VNDAPTRTRLNYLSWSNPIVCRGATGTEPAQCPCRLSPRRLGDAQEGDTVEMQRRTVNAVFGGGPAGKQDRVAIAHRPGDLADANEFWRPDGASGPWVADAMRLLVL
jgi:hypothetical protein